MKPAKEDKCTLQEQQTKVKVGTKRDSEIITVRVNLNLGKKEGNNGKKEEAIVWHDNSETTIAAKKNFQQAQRRRWSEFRMRNYKQNNYIFIHYERIDNNRARKIVGQLSFWTISCYNFVIVDTKLCLMFGPWFSEPYT